MLSSALLRLIFLGAKQLFKQRVLSWGNFRGFCFWLTELFIRAGSIFGSGSRIDGPCTAQVVRAGQHGCRCTQRCTVFAHVRVFVALASKQFVQRDLSDGLLRLVLGGNLMTLIRVSTR